ncbi:hypothetical protein CRE_19041 [Caenorhabditis remanei]|uniref:Uncharacterized protein n=1 Tax=Caenorhabditis remanei TaxID=31234 RepID=E3LLB5_CAERE|nr:hypothetical protein CRE_19041 [Caenorhabditis remanei]
MLDVLSSLSFLFLILYRHFKKLQCDDLHAPIFNQLFGVSAVCVLINLLALTVRILWEAGVFDDNTALFVVCVPAMFQFYSHSGVFCCIVSFSFLSAVQRIIILYFPDLKFLVTGIYLKFVIALMWFPVVHYNYILFDECEDETFANLAINCTNSNDEVLLLTYQFSFITMNLLTVIFYIHINQVLSKLATVSPSHKPIVLYHFVPVLVLQMIFIALNVLAKIVFTYFHSNTGEIEEVLVLFTNLTRMIFLPLVPIVVSFSYISSRILYHRRKTSESEKKEFEYHHAPIFSQLYYISAFCLFTTNCCFALTIIGNWSGNGTIYKLLVIFLVYIETLFTIFYNVVLGSIIMFSFLAAFQKIVILYIPSYKWSVTGIFIRLEILSVYIILAFYGWMDYKCISENSDILMCPDQKLRVMKIFFNCIIFIMSLVTGYFYYHVYKLARNLSRQNNASQVHSFLFLISEGISEVFETNMVYIVCMMSVTFATPAVPVIVSLSYIASKENIRQIFMIIVYPMWQELTA